MSSLGSVGNYSTKTLLEVVKLSLCCFEWMVEVAAVVIAAKAPGPSFAEELVPGQEEAEGWIEATVPLWELQQHRRWIV